MRIAGWQLQDNGWKLEQLLAKAQVQCRNGYAPQFVVAGMCQMPTMPRKSPPSVVRTNRAYVGGERFYPSDLVITHLQSEDALEISIVLAPVKLSLIREVSTVRLPLDEAFQKFKGLEDWLVSLVPELKPPDPEGVPSVPVVSTEEVRASDAWGAW